MPELVVEQVTSAGALKRALSPGQADDHGEFDGDRLTVDDADAAEQLVETYPNVHFADRGIETDTYPDEQVTRAEVDTDGATYECGVNGCSREVDSPTAVCWQHAEDDDEDDEDDEDAADTTESE